MATSACPIQVARQGVRVFSSLESAIVATDSFFSRNVAFGTHRGLKQRALNSPGEAGNGARKGRGMIMGIMDHENDPGKDVSGRWIGTLIAFVIVIWAVYMVARELGIPD
jgi:hypothetical protein